MCMVPTMAVGPLCVIVVAELYVPVGAITKRLVLGTAASTHGKVLGGGTLAAFGI